MKLCKDCKHMKIGLLDRLIVGYGSAKCTMSPKKDSVNPCTGLHEREFYYCSTERDNGVNGCGPEGKLWEPRS